MHASYRFGLSVIHVRWKHAFFGFGFPNQWKGREVAFACLIQRKRAETDATCARDGLDHVSVSLEAPLNYGVLIRIHSCNRHVCETSTRGVAVSG